MTKKYTITEIISIWAAVYDEDMMTEYPGFIKRLTEEENAPQDSDPVKGSDNNKLGVRTK